MRQGRRCKSIGRIELIWVVGGDERGQDRYRDDDPQGRHREQRRRMTAELAPDDLAHRLGYAIDHRVRRERHLQARHLSAPYRTRGQGTSRPRRRGDSDDHEHRDEHNDAQHHRVVAVHGREVEEIPEAGPREDDLDEQGSGEQVRQIKRDQRDRRQRGVLEGDVDDRTLPDPLLEPYGRSRDGSHRASTSG